MLGILTPLLDDPSGQSQFANRRDWGTEHHLLRLYDFVCGESETGRFVYLAVINIDGALDHVPHESLIRTLEGLKVDSFIGRYTAKWPHFLCKAQDSKWVAPWQVVSPRSGPTARGRSLHLRMAAPPQNGCIFCSRLTTPHVLHHTRWCPLALGLPQGGVLSSFLWPQRSNPIRRLSDKIGAGDRSQIGELETTIRTKSS